MGFVIEFRRPFIKCTVRFCNRKHYAKGYCSKHYDHNCRRGGRYSWEEKQRINRSNTKTQKVIDKNKIIQPKDKSALYQALKDSGITVFCYKDAMKVIGWNYERTKKHILKLVKVHKVYCNKDSVGGRGKEACFTLLK